MATLGVLVLAWPIASARADDPTRTTRTRLDALRAAVERHRTATGELPRDTKHLEVLARLYVTRVPIVHGAPVDGWERPFVYVLAADVQAGYRLYSTGANGGDEAGGGDDLGAAREGRPGQRPEDVERALQLLPVLLLVVLAPIAWTFIRAARRGLR